MTTTITQRNHPEGAITNYRLGRRYVHELVEAIEAMQEGAHKAAREHEEKADKMLWPLGAYANPEDLREFIAGMACEAELQLDALRRHYRHQPF